MQSAYILYSSEGCHLCEQALAMCLLYLSSEQITIVDIVDDESLVERYGMSIPVLKRNVDNEELYWPFTTEQIIEFI